MGLNHWLIEMGISMSAFEKGKYQEQRYQHPCLCKFFHLPTMGTGNLMFQMVHLNIPQK
jgi:hypothetical protein